jgi:predicted ATPase
VIVGAFPVRTARAIVIDDSDSTESLPEVISALVAKSLLYSSAAAGEVVYRMLETTRVFALERFCESDEHQQVRLRHASFYEERLARGLEDMGLAFHGQVSDLGNVRAGLVWSFSSPSGYGAGVRLAAAAAQLFLTSGLVTECHQWCRQALAVIAPPEIGTLVELRLQEALAHSATFAKTLDNDVRAALTRGLEIARAIGGGDDQIRLLCHLAMFLLMAGGYRDGLEAATRSEQVRNASPAGMIVSHAMLGAAEVACGNHVRGQEHCEESLRGVVQFGEVRAMPTAYTVARTTLARSLWLRGQPDHAAMLVREVVRDIGTVTHAVDKGLRLAYSETILAWCGEWNEAGRLLDMLSDHVERYSLSSYRGLALGLRGELLVKTGQTREGCRLLRAASSELKATKSTLQDTTFASALAEGLADTGEIDEALVIAEGALDLARSRGGTWDEPDLLRLKGALLVSRSGQDQRTGNDILAQAIDLARRQGALAWELRAVTEVARQRLKHGGRPDDLLELSAVYAQFTEGFQTPDLQAARDLLDPHVPASSRGPSFSSRGAALLP